MTLNEEIEEPSTLVFGKYRLLESLGHGGMAEVYKALSVGAAGFRRPVVIKRILPHLSSNRQFVEMFIKEASIAAALDHPNIVQVFDLGEHEEDLFMVLEYVPGLDLGTVMQFYLELGKKLPHQLVAFVAVDMCKALECAHGRRDGEGRTLPVIHRDVSPQNVLLSLSGSVKLADFGLAMAMSDSRVTSPGVIKGKLGYMSPEQARGQRDLDIRSDLFSLGVVIFEAITGRRLFVGATAGDTIRRIREAKVPDIVELAPKVPQPLADLVHRLLSLSRDDRPKSAKDVRRTLSHYLRSVHPPVDATTLASVVRYVVRERAKQKDLHKEADTNALTQAYQSSDYSSVEDEDDFRSTVSEPALRLDELDKEELDKEETIEDKEATEPYSFEKGTDVIISRVVSIGESKDE